MSTVAKCPNRSCGHVSGLGADPLGRVFRCPRCLTKFRGEPAGPGSGSGPGWPAAAPRREAVGRPFRASSASASRGFGWGSGSGSGGVAVLAPPVATAAESGEFLAAAFDHDEPWDDPAETAGFEWNESSYSVPAMGPPDASRTGIFAAVRPLELEDRSVVGLGLARFRLLGLLGEGRHASVYRAFDPTLERHVALKLARGEAPRASRTWDRFLGEARALAMLRHPGIVAIHEAGRDGDRPYLALDLIDGRGLDELLADGRLSPRRAAEIAADLADALAHAHGLGIVHRDVKPANVRIDSRGGVHLMDFGIALRPDSPDVEPDAVAGTPAYLAPELLGDGRRPALPAADQYALGVVLHEMLRGRPPFDGPAASVLARARAGEPPALDVVAPEVPRALAEICRKATAGRPDGRYPSCRDLAVDLRRWLRGESPRARRRSWFA